MTQREGERERESERERKRAELCTNIMFFLSIQVPNNVMSRQGFYTIALGAAMNNLEKLIVSRIIKDSSLHVPLTAFEGEGPNDHIAGLRLSQQRALTRRDEGPKNKSPRA